MHARLTMIELHESLRPSRTVYHARLRRGTAGIDAEYATSGSNMQYASSREGKHRPAKASLLSHALDILYPKYNSRSRNRVTDRARIRAPLGVRAGGDQRHRVA